MNVFVGPFVGWLSLKEIISELRPLLDHVLFNDKKSCRKTTFLSFIVLPGSACKKFDALVHKALHKARVSETRATAACILASESI